MENQFKNDGSFLEQMANMSRSAPPPAAIPSTTSTTATGFDPYSAAYGYDPQQQQQQQQGGGVGAGGMYDATGAGGAYPPEYAAYYAQYYGGMYGNTMSLNPYATTGAYPSGPAASAMLRGQPSRILWVGNLHPDTTEEDLRLEFARYGMIEQIRMLIHKNCAFVTFYEQNAASEAYRNSIGKFLKGSELRLGWGKPDEKVEPENLNPPCRNLWVGNLSSTVSEETLRREFGQYGQIDHIKMLTMKNCCFITFGTVEQATAAKNAMQGKMIHDRAVRINFGKDNPREKAPAQVGGPAPWDKEAVAASAGGGGGGPSSSSASSSSSSSSSSAPPPPYADPPVDAKIANIIEKIAVYIGRNGLEFEAHVKQYQKDNPKFAFLFGGDGHDYYRWKVYTTANLIPANANSAPLPPSQPPPPPSNNPPLPSSGNYHAVSYPSQAPDGYGQFSNQRNAYIQDSAQPPPPPSSSFSSNGQNSFANSQYGRAPGIQEQKLSQQEENELATLVSNLSGTRESIKNGKEWMLTHLEKGQVLVQALVSKMASLEEPDKRLHLVYLINDVLHHCMKKRATPSEPDPFAKALAEQEALVKLCQYAYNNQPPKTQEQLVKVLNLWADRNIYDSQYISNLINSMKNYRGSKDVGYSDDPRSQKRYRDYDAGADSRNKSSRRE